MTPDFKNRLEDLRLQLKLVGDTAKENVIYSRVCVLLELARLEGRLEGTERTGNLIDNALKKVLKNGDTK